MRRLIALVTLVVVCSASPSPAEAEVAWPRHSQLRSVPLHLPDGTVVRIGGYRFSNQRPVVCLAIDLYNDCTPGRYRFDVYPPRVFTKGTFYTGLGLVTIDLVWRPRGAPGARPSFAVSPGTYAPVLAGAQVWLRVEGAGQIRINDDAPIHVRRLKGRVFPEILP